MGFLTRTEHSAWLRGMLESYRHRAELDAEPRMRYVSVYADHYQQPSKAGEAYDLSVENPFELAIFALEREVLLQIFQGLCCGDPETRYLDFACGTGRILTVFRHAIRVEVGVDTSLGQLRVARQKVPDAELVHGNLVTDPGLLSHRQFELITSFRLLLHLEPRNRPSVLRTLRAHLAPGGVLVVDNHMNRYSVLGWLAFLAHKVLRMPRKPHVPSGRRGIIGTMSEQEVRDTLAAAGLSVVKVHRLFVLPGHRSFLLLPARWLVGTERFLSRLPLLNRLSKNQIFVCRAAR
jgi:2-polyprenyl-3-methyl-5-hydroxy-6-metoxy-1,4-benzoquinol methylase